tara:strand:- start:36 stop:2210 length:2175 start_codon:yes stop_codon:yes gene_type:complete
MKKLQRTLTLPTAIAISIGGMLSGIFVLPGIAVGITGSSIWLAFLVAALCILPAVLSKSELATAMPKSGGTYVYIERAFGPLFGTVSGLGLWLSLLLKSAFSLVGLSAYLYVVVQIDESLSKIVALISLGLILILNVFGVKKVGNTQLAIVSVSIISLLLVIAFGFNSFDSEMLSPVFSDGNYGFISGVAFLYISYAGVTKVAAVAGEIKSPEKNLPRSMLISLFLITAVYVLVALVLVGNVEASALSTDIRPIYTLSKVLGGETFGYAAGVIGVITLLSMANSGVLASSRFPFAMARDKMLPGFFGTVNSSFLTPVNSIIVTCIIIGLAVFYLDVEKIAKLASAFKVMMFVSVNLAVIVLRETSAQWYNPKYKSPFYPYVQLFGIISGFVLLFYLGFMPIVSVAGIFVLGFLIFLAYGKNTNRKGVFSNYGFLSFLFKGSPSGQDQTDNRQNTSSVEDISNVNAEIVVPLLGDETSTEMLVEMASSINDKSKINTINLLEVPNQTFLEAIDLDTPESESKKRRIEHLKKYKKLNISYESIATHDVANSIDNITGQSKCKWLVMEWDGREHSGIFVGNPIGWLLKNVNSNLGLFKDNGVRRFSKVLIALRPGRRNQAFIDVADKICQHFGASLTLLNIVSEGEKEGGKLKKTSQEILSSTKSKSELKIVKSNDPVEIISEESAGYDLLILGTPEKDNWINVLFGVGEDRFVKMAACSVLRLTIR